ncbi:transcription activator for actt3 protein [Colletotrichum musicola]|uniref:Transcription activator for actt3 protein n=1 Tax=Colletotrichum musicola TaxID=2175873 RepID=A0A8H6JHW1_9PEZI|nr:transcription activator for actt3 protein [Colletotrichum musicola]
MDLELDTFMNTDFDFEIDLDVDVDMMMRFDTSAKHHSPILPPISEVEVPKKPPSSIVGQLEDVWNQVMSGTSELQSIIGAVISGRGHPSSSGNPCSCPNLIGRLQLFASNAKLAKHGGIAQDRAAGRHPHSRLPLDLLLFLDEVVHQTISAVLSCGACSRESRVRLTLYLIVDWLADVLRATLETDLLRPSSSHKGLEAGKTTPPGGPFASTSNPDKDVNPAPKTAMGKREDPEDDGVERSWKHETNRLQLGSFRLEGELWQICIRELLKTRLNRLSRTVERIRGSRDRDEHHNRAGCIRTGVTSSSLDRVLAIMTADVYSKIEFLFGMIELWET